ncbi:MAG: MFS transporter [Sphingomonas sp.]
MLAPTADAASRDCGDVPASPFSNGYRIYVMLVLGLIYVVSSVDRMMVSIVADPVKHEFGLSDTALGVLTGLFFAVSFSVCGIPIGILVDRLKRTRLLAGLVLVWSALTFTTGFAGSYAMLALARVGVGASEAGVAPTSMSLITDFFPPRQRGRAMSFFYVSTPIGVSLGLVMGGFLADRYGWRGAFLVAGLPGIALALLLLTTVKEPVRGYFERSRPRETAARVSAASVLDAYRRIPALWLLAVGGMFLIIGQSGTNAFATPFLMRVHGLSIRDAGYALGVAHFVPGVIGALGGGVLADRLARRSVSLGPLVIGLIQIVNFPVAACAYLVGDWHVAIALLALHNCLLATYYGSFFSTYLSLSPVALRGTLASILAVAMTLMGYGFGPVVAGAASDFFQRWGTVDPLRLSQATVAAMFLLSGLFLLAAGRAIGRMAPIADR